MISLVVNAVEYPVCLVTPPLQGALDAMYDAGRLSELVDPHAHMTAVWGDWPTPPHTEWPRPRLGGLYWPVVGAARYAFGCFLVDAATLEAMKIGMTAAGTGAVTVRFRDQPDPSAETPRDVALNFLAARPLVENGDSDGYVLLLVDDRYALLHQCAEAVTGDTWGELVAVMGATVGDAADADYLTPSVRWTVEATTGRSVAWLLDVAAASVGSRIVTVPGGNPTLQRPTALRKAEAEGAHAVLITAGRFVGGGQLAASDLTFGFPDTAKIVFGAPDETTPVVVTVTGTSPGWPDGTHVTHWCDAPAASTGGQRSALAAQWADDWEAWQYAPLDSLYAGFVAVPDSGFIWAVEWFHSSTQGYTKFVRPPHWYGYLLPPSIGADPVEYGCHLEEDEDGVVSVTTETLIGEGLELEEGDDPEDCPKIALRRPTPQPDTGADCVTWFTWYLHLGGLWVYEGQTLYPGQPLGWLGPYSNGAHLHWTLGDGSQAQNPVGGVITAGVGADIDSWVTGEGLTVVGPRVGTPPSPLADFTVGELTTILAHTRLPIDLSFGAWEAHVTSTLHTGFDYYAYDLLVPSVDVQGQPVYAAFTGTDVTTTVEYTGYFTGIGHIVVLKHTIGDCPEDSGEPDEENNTVYRDLSAFDVGCNLTFDGTGKLVVDTEVLAGDNAVTSLDGTTDDDGCPIIGFDKVPTSTTTETLQNDTVVVQTGSTVTITKTRTVYTNHFNAALVHVDRTAGAPTDTTYTVDICLGVQCCLADCVTLTDVDWVDQYGLAPLTPVVTFGVSGGLPGDAGSGYSVHIDWDNGDTETQVGDGPFEFTGAFDTPGLYEVVITVTDRCGEHTFVYPVTVGEECACEGCEASGYPQAYTFTLSGGTGDFASLNGAWEIHNIGGCAWAWIQNGWTVTGSGTELTFADENGNTLVYSGTAVNCCAAATDVTLDTSTGTGTEPTLTGNEITPGSPCAACCTTAPTPSECCDLAPGDLGSDGMPNTLTVVISTTIPGLSGTYTVTRPSSFGSWTRAGAPNFEDPSLSFGCVGGDYSLVITAVCDGGMPPFGATLTAAPTCCDPFKWNGSGSTNTGCYTSTLITATVTP